MHLTKSVAEPTWTAAPRISPSTRRVESRIIFCNASSYNSRVPSTSPTIVQVLPAMESGVESGTLEIAKAVVQRGWASVVISSGGRLVTQLQDEGTEHIESMRGRKSAFTFFEPKFRRFIDQQKSQTSFNAQSRLPAWVRFAFLSKTLFKLGFVSPQAWSPNSVTIQR